MSQGIPLKYFMWAHQHSTQHYLQEYAEDLFIIRNLRLIYFRVKIILVVCEDPYIDNAYGTAH